MPFEREKGNCLRKRLLRKEKNVKVSLMIEYFSGKAEKIVEEVENVGDKHFLLLLTCF